MEVETHNEILRAIGKLEGKVDGINDRLDRVNGRLDKHDEELDKTGKKLAYAKGRASVSAIFTSAIVSIIAGVIIYYLTKI